MQWGLTGTRGTRDREGKEVWRIFHTPPDRHGLSLRPWLLPYAFGGLDTALGCGILLLSPLLRRVLNTDDQVRVGWILAERRDGLICGQSARASEISRYLVFGLVGLVLLSRAGSFLFRAENRGIVFAVTFVVGGLGISVPRFGFEGGGACLWPDKVSQLIPGEELGGPHSPRSNCLPREIFLAVAFIGGVGIVGGFGRLWGRQPLARTILLGIWLRN